MEVVLITNRPKALQEAEEFAKNFPDKNINNPISLKFPKSAV